MSQDVPLKPRPVVISRLVMISVLGLAVCCSPWGRCCSPWSGAFDVDHDRPNPKGEISPPTANETLQQIASNLRRHR
jgi:hypothetical protein